MTQMVPVCPKRHPPHGRHAVMCLFWLVVLCSFLFTGNGRGELPPAGSLPPSMSPKTRSDDDAVRSETEKLASLNQQFLDVSRLGTALETEIDRYKQRLAAYGNLLLLPDTGADDLEKALAELIAIIDALEKQIRDIGKKNETVDHLLKETEDNTLFYQKQFDLPASAPSYPGHTDPAGTPVGKLLDILSAKKKVLEKTRQAHLAQLLLLTGARQSFVERRQNLENRVREKKKDVLFQRKGSFLALMRTEQIALELREVNALVRRFSSAAFWKEGITRVFGLGGFLPVSFLVLYMIVLLLTLRFKGFCIACREHVLIQPYPARQFALDLIYPSLPLFGSTLFFYTYTQVQSLYGSTPLIQMGIGILWTFLATRWFIDLVALLARLQKYPLLDRFLPQIRAMLFWIRYLILAHIVVERIVGDHSVMLLFGRLVFETVFLFWQLNFSKQLKTAFKKTSPTETVHLSAVKSFVYFFWFLIPGGALLLDLSGYGSLSVYWLSAVMQSATVFLWTGILFFVLKEWQVRSPDTEVVETEGDKVTGHPFKWVIMCVCWLGWGGLLVTSLIIAWGGRRAVIVGFFKALNYPVTVGSMQFRLSGAIYALLILMLTHAAVRIWHRLIKERILNYSGLDTGLRDSISTIAAYVIWTLGILFSLNAFGINATSLTVALGALGIGLGFGLQNIFNNFVSGIILLFERPIQVGDAIEINGVWASVKKINVRSTVVQTWDNASLIIPNSEFISSQVTNWSFKDMRVRRNIVVGVAYGSDTELVRRTLLEIAAGMPKVLKMPQPDVLFADFGDSALIFRLRVWTLVEHMLTVETGIRFEIDRLFRERKITIAFPQRDIHIHTVTDPNEKVAAHPANPIPADKSLPER